MNTIDVSIEDQKEARSILHRHKIETEYIGKGIYKLTWLERLENRMPLVEYRNAVRMVEIAGNCCICQKTQPAACKSQTEACSGQAKESERKSMSKAVNLIEHSLLNNYGRFEYFYRSREEAKAVLNEYGFKSYIQSEPVALFLTELPGTIVTVNNSVYLPAVNDIAIVFRMRGKVDSNIIYSFEKMISIGYDFGILKRTL